MKNKVAKTNFILLSIIVVLVLVFCVLSVGIPFTNYTFRGFARSISLGLDFGDGTSAVYTIEKADFYSKSDDAMTTDAVKIVQQQINDVYGDGCAEIVSDSKIKITVPDTTISSEVILTMLEMKAETGEDAETFITGADIEDAEYRMNGTTHGVYITFTKEGKQKFANLTRTVSENSGSINIYLNKDYDNGQAISISEEITTGYAFISAGSKSNAKLYAKQITNSKYGLDFTLVEGSTTTVHSNFDTWQKAMFAVATCLMIVGSMVYLIIKYKQLGLISSLALMMSALISLITITLIPQIRLTIASFVGMTLGYILQFALMLVLLNNCSKEYADGKKLPSSLKSGYKKSVMPVIDTLVLTMIVCLVAFIFGNVTFVGLCSTLSIMLLVNAVTTLGIMRWFIYMYLSINPGKAKLVNFTRQEGVNEIK